MKPLKLFLKLSAKNLAVNCLGTALFLCLTATGVSAQTDPPKQQLPTTPLPGNTPQPRPVIVRSPESDSVELVNRKLKELEKREKEEEEQERRNNTSFGERLTFGGNFGLQFGNYTFIDVSPVVGYKLSETFMVGPGVVYNYISVRDFGSYHLYGGKVFGRASLYNLIDESFFSNVFVHSEYELLNIPRLTIDLATNEIDESRVTIGTLLAGLGNRFMIGDRSSIDALVLVNLTPSPYSPYSGPLIIKFGFTGGW